MQLAEYDRRSSRATPPCSPIVDDVDEVDQLLDIDDDLLDIADMLDVAGSPTIESDVEIAEM
jgi:hypothetical protein